MSLICSILFYNILYGEDIFFVVFNNNFFLYLYNLFIVFNDLFVKRENIFFKNLMNFF